MVLSKTSEKICQPTCPNMIGATGEPLYIDHRWTSSRHLPSTFIARLDGDPLPWVSLHHADRVVCSAFCQPRFIMNLKEQIELAVAQSFERLGVTDSPPVVKQAQRREFGHYQVNGVMGAAKTAKTNPRELATKVTEALDLPMAAKLEVAGPGFVNVHLDATSIAEQLDLLGNDVSLPSPEPRHFAVDYSAPNLMKEMHIGHLRTNAIGDSIVRVLEAVGHQVTRVNHVGDWGAQFGSLLAYLDQLHTTEISTELKDLEVFYQSASKLFKSDEAFAERARGYVVRLQSGDEQCLKLWRQFIEESIQHCQEVYKRLDISLTREDIHAESAYNDDLPIVVAELEQQGLIEESDGALCVFLDEFTGKEGNPLPAIVRKSDGGFPYMATDLAAVRYRAEKLRADTVLYVVGAPQQLHLKQVFAVAQAAGYLTDQEFRHLPFGSIMKSDGKPFKTRDGAEVKLIDVIDEAVARAHQLVKEKNPDLSEEKHRMIAEIVGVGAMKYAELSKNRGTDYIFDWDILLSFEGNTAPYLQYAYTRIQSIFRKAGVTPGDLRGKITLREPAELDLGVKLLQFPEAIETALEDYQMNILCNYLYELSGQFMSFYEHCHILKQTDQGIQQSRLRLAAMTANTLQQGLGFLGIKTVDRM